MLTYILTLSLLSYDNWKKELHSFYDLLSWMRALKENVDSIQFMSIMISLVKDSIRECLVINALQYKASSLC